MITTVGSLFSGIGGIDISFQQAGFNIAWAIEKDAPACRTYRYNFPDIPLIEADIRGIDTDSLGNVDVLAAGFPCQPFSVAGNQQGFRDTRGNLFYEVIRFAEKLKPCVIFLENVPNLTDHDGGHTFNAIYNALVGEGYFVHYRVMRASEYGGVPQIRDRVYIVAFKGIELSEQFHFPEKMELATTAIPLLHQSEKKHPIYYINESDSYYAKVSRIVKKRNCIYRVYHESIKPTQNMMCPTLTASMGTQRNQVPLVLDDYGIRKLTIHECLAFQGFPDSFKFPNTITLEDAYKQIGNSVCIPVVTRIAARILATISTCSLTR